MSKSKILLDSSPNLSHLAIIMDGNGRWAQNRGKSRKAGHKEGAKRVREITTWCAKNHIAYLTLYAFSTENWNRPKQEVDFLLKLLAKYLKDEAKTYHKHQIRFRAIGDISAFSKELQNLIKHLESSTKSYTNLTQTLALNYGSKDELARTFAKIQQNLNQNPQKKLNQNLNSAKIQSLIEQHLDTCGLPSVDLLIRTGGEQRLSNFLLWQASYAELFFSKSFFPDFDTDELEKIIIDFSKRTRRFGGL
ncbi:di-trans,poly-cis-decaprenylcistransferase [Helicobacter sp. T3_23-1059]